MSTGLAPMYRWETIPWKKLQRTVFKLQKRIYRATTLTVQVRLTNATLLRSRVRWKLSCTVLKPSRGGDIPA